MEIWSTSRLSCIKKHGCGIVGYVPAKLSHYRLHGILLGHGREKKKKKALLHGSPASQVSVVHRYPEIIWMVTREMMTSITLGRILLDGWEIPDESLGACSEMHGLKRACTVSFCFLLQPWVTTVTQLMAKVTHSWLQSYSLQLKMWSGLPLLDGMMHIKSFPLTR